MTINNDWTPIMDDIEKRIEDFVYDHKDKGLCCYTIGQYDETILVRISSRDDAPTPDYDTPLVRRLEKELQEKDESLDFWIKEAHKIGVGMTNEQNESSCIKDGNLIERNDEVGDEVLLYANFEDGCVNTHCGDFYYDYSIPFDDFIKFAEFIKKERGRYGTRAGENR